MNQTFSFQRWTLLVGKHWAENRKRYLLSVGAYMSLVFLWFVFVMLTDNSDPLAPNLQQVTYFFSLFLVGPFYASQFFKEVHSRAKGINHLMVPASTLEKFLCSLFYAIILFFIVFTVAYYLVSAITVGVANAVHPWYSGQPNAWGVAMKAHIANVFVWKEVPGNLAYYFFLMFLAAQSAALLGSAYFAQYSYIKTAISLTLIFLLFYMIEYYLLKHFMPRGDFYEGLWGFSVQSDTGNKLVRLPEWVGASMKILFQYAFPPIFWVTTYFRLKEKEV